MSRIYIAGRMNGMPDLNFPLFRQKAEMVRARGHEALNPVEIGQKHFGTVADLPQQEYLIKDVLELVTCDSIMLLDGWEGGIGAVCEAAIAKTLNLDFYDQDGDPLPTPDQIVVRRSYLKRA